MQRLVAELLTCATLVPTRDMAGHKHNKLAPLLFGSVRGHWLSQQKGGFRMKTRQRNTWGSTPSFCMGVQQLVCSIRGLKTCSLRLLQICDEVNLNPVMRRAEISFSHEQTSLCLYDSQEQIAGPYNLIIMTLLFAVDGCSLQIPDKQQKKALTRLLYHLSSTE